MLPVKWRRSLAALSVVMTSTGCTDKAALDYAQCVQFDIAGDAGAAMAACSAAMAADPNSTSGKAASARVAEIKAKEAAFQKAEAEAAPERRRLLSSADPNDWRALIAKFPVSAEAKAAQDRLATSQTICASLRTWSLSTTLNCGGKPVKEHLEECIASLKNVEDSVARTVLQVQGDQAVQVMVTMAQAQVDAELPTLAATRTTIAGHPSRTAEVELPRSVDSLTTLPCTLEFCSLQ